jgi:hypothetical protein
MVAYTTREAVKAALDMKETARSNSQVDEAIAAASDTIEGALNRRFYPEIKTVSVDWPNETYARSYRFWLESNEAISLSAVTSGGTLLSPSTYALRRSDDKPEPPYDRLELDLGTSASFSSGDTFQQSLVLTGLFGYSNVTVSAGSTAATGSAAVTTVDVSNGAAIGVGSLILIGSERMTVTEKSMVATSDTGTLTAAPNSQSLAVTSGAAYTVGEVLLLDSERVRVDDIAGNNLIVTRAWDGTTLGAHNTATVYVSRRLTVERGVLGTTAASFAASASVRLWKPPGLIAQWAKAEALSDLMQGRSAYARTVGSGDNEVQASTRPLADIRKRAMAAFARYQMDAV